MAGPAGRLVLAQVTESRMRAPLDDPSMSRFALAFDVVTRLARESPGFRWQLEHAQPGHPVLRPDRPQHVLTVSAWVDYPSLHAFVYRSSHGQALLHRQRWFEPVERPSTALWWVAEDRLPSLDDALARLTHLRRHGPAPQAFTLTRRCDVSGRPEGRRRPHGR